MKELKLRDFSITPKKASEVSTFAEILKPQPAKSRKDSDEIDKEKKNVDDKRRKSPVKPIDVSEFEHGIAPPDPWDEPQTLKNDLESLDSILGGSTLKSKNIPNSSTPPLPPRETGDNLGKQKLQLAGASDPAPPKLPDRKPPLPQKPFDIRSKIVNLGYSEQAANVAIKVFGEQQEHNTLVKFAAFFDRVKTHKFPHDDVVMAFVIFEDKPDQAVSYLKDFSELKEFGFSTDKIQEALMSNNFDKNLALETLMSGS